MPVKVIVHSVSALIVNKGSQYMLHIEKY